MPSEFFDAARAARYARFDYDFPERLLAGRVILAPGGSGGLGAATAALLVREGATVVVGYRANRTRAEQLAEMLNQRGPGRVVLLGGDLQEAATREQFVEQGRAVTGEIYGLVNFLGDPARVEFARLGEAELREAFRLNYDAPVLLAKRVGEHMQERGIAGSIVFLATMQAVAAFESSLNYAGPKAALVQAARILAKQWGGRTNIRVNVVAPGVNLAGMAEASIQAGKYDGFIRSDAIARFGRPEDVARVIRLLLEPDNYLTGQVITVDGGFTLRRDRG
jgi:NAD(P)-dependent dehydrogenase (short-subunit alcohol dehydrogenase family)